MRKKWRIGSGGDMNDGKRTMLVKICSVLFVAEWCHRFMLAKVALAPSSDTLAVVGGACRVDMFRPGLAVVGGAMDS